MGKVHRIWVVFLVIILTYNYSNANSDLKSIREKITTELLAPEINTANIKELMETIEDDGSWPDINYKDVSRTGFQHSEHLHHLVNMSRAYKKQGSVLKGNKRLKKAIGSALDFWLKNDFICDNWWWNQIGTPDALVKVLLIMDNDLSEWQIDKTLKIVSRADIYYAWGARPSGDRIKIAGIQAKRLLFDRDSSGFNSIIEAIENEIKFTMGRGLQYDYSFHHRDDHVNNTLTYGKQYADVFAYWAATVSGTKYRFCQKSIHLLVDYYLDGICKMLIYGEYPDPGARNREITRRGNLNAFGSATPEELLQATNYRREELREIVMIRKGKATPSLSFSRFYWLSEHFTFQRPDFFTSVRMYSNREYSMEEPYNGEGLMNHYRGDGTNYISRTGKEYDGLSPVFDWQKIPGATIMQRAKMPPAKEIQQKGLTSFVGAVTDGKYGAVGFDFKSPLDPLKAKKAWFFFDKKYICLGAGITGDSPLNVVTTLNQCRLHGNVLVSERDQIKTLDKGAHQLSEVDWVWHDSIGYIFPKSARACLSNHTQTGSWYKVNHSKSSPKKEIGEEVFKLWLSQGTHPRNATYQYIVVPAIAKKEMKRVYENNPIEVIKNTPEVQAVKSRDLELCEAVFYEPGSIRVSKELLLEMKTPGIVMIKYKKGEVTSISVEDPTRKLNQIRLAVSMKVDRGDLLYDAVWNKKEGLSYITIRLPQNVYKGKSVTIEL